MNKKFTTEKQLQTAILARLSFEKLTKNVIWYQRLAAESDQNCKAGTPDILALVNCGNGKITALFIEVKKPGVKRLRYEQKIFFEWMEGKPHILCVMINDLKQVGMAIKKARGL